MRQIGKELMEKCVEKDEIGEKKETGTKTAVLVFRIR